MQTISTFISPIHQHSAKFSTPSKIKDAHFTEPSEIKTQDWCDLAFQRNWESAILLYLRERWRQAPLLWTVINEICAEALPKDRYQTRELKKELLKALGEL